MPERRASFRVLAVLGSVFYMLLRGNEPLMASDDAASVNAKLAELKSATEITLLVVPYPTEFNRHVDKIRLRNVACVYQFVSDRGPTFDKVFDVLSHADIQYDNGPRSADLRVGIIFRRYGEVLSEFYSDDWGGRFKVSGSWDGRRIVASADMPSLLRALPPRPRIPDELKLLMSRRSCWSLRDPGCGDSALNWPGVPALTSCRMASLI